MACDINSPLARQVFLSLYAYYIDSQFSEIEKCDKPDWPPKTMKLCQAALQMHPEGEGTIQYIKKWIDLFCILTDAPSIKMDSIRRVLYRGSQVHDIFSYTGRRKKEKKWKLKVTSFGVENDLDNFIENLFDDE